MIDVDGDELGDFAESGPARLPSSYHLGRSQVTEDVLDGYVEEGLISSEVRLACRVPGHEEVPAPKAYEAIVFHDFLTAGLRFPCERFMCEVLERFNLQIHHLTPNAFSRFAMALKMMGSEVEVNTFAKYYESQFHERVVIERPGQTEKRAEFGSYNFIPQKSQGTMSIIPSYLNKWPNWQDFWFYVRVCTDEEVTSAMENGLPKAGVLVSQLTPMEGIRLAMSFEGGRSDAFALEKFYQTSRQQISRDLVEEWIALDMWPLQQGTGFAEFVDSNGYRGPRLHVRRPVGYDCDFNYVRYVEESANLILGLYDSKEHKAKIRGLSGVRRLNRVFDAMRLIYADRSDSSTSETCEVVGRAVRGRGCGRGRGRKRRTTELEAAKRKRARASEEADVEIGREIARPARRRSR